MKMDSDGATDAESQITLFSPGTTGARGCLVVDSEASIQ